MPKILIIEDDPSLRQEVMEWLIMEDYEVFCASDGMVGVKTAFRERPDLIVCDIMMPHLDGYSVLLEIRVNPATAGIPFIFITAKAAYNDIRKGMDLGADDYITKPFTHLEFFQAIKSRLAKKIAQEQEHQRKIEQLQYALTQEHEQRLLKAKLMAMFSHDFQSPLSTIILTNSLLSDHSDHMDKKRRLVHFNHIDVAARLLVQMLDDVLLVAQMETSNLNLKLERLDVRQFLQQLIENFQVIHGDRYPILLQSELTTPLLMDVRLLRQIASNLILNAIKYSPPGNPVRVIVDYAEGQCRLIVQDQGIGIPEADQARLFEAFQRGSNVGNVPGTGLGLAIVKQAVDFQGGAIQLACQAGMGTTVTVTIPTKLSGRSD